jgi:uncharacterized membrane protein (DUF4010 family)
MSRLSWADLRSALLQLGATAVVLSLLPNRPGARAVAAAVRRVIFSGAFGSRAFARGFTVVSAMALAAGTGVAVWTLLP